MSDERLLTTWVVVSPHGLSWVGLAKDEASAWCVALGWPDEKEIEEHKADGWYAAEATITWQRKSYESDRPTD